LMMGALSKLLARHAETRAPITADELKRALRENELLLHYQPIIAQHAGEWSLRGAEALVRWQHPERGLLYPGQFLKLANLIESGAEAKEVIADGMVSVNGEVEDRRGRQLRDGDVVEIGGMAAKVEAPA